MAVTVYWITAARPHQLAIIARPRGHDWLADEIADLRRQGIEAVVSMLTPAENDELGLHDEQRLCEQGGLKFLSLSIPDRSVPEASQVRHSLNQIIDLVTAGCAVGFHCRASIGRSSVMAALVMARLGWDPAEAFRAISDARGCPVPDTPEQEAWVKRFVARETS